MDQTKTGKRQGWLAEFIFYGNYFYGLCAVALSVEAMLQQQVPLNEPSFFFLLFIATVLFYSYPYISKKPATSRNPRTNWYRENYRLTWWAQVAMTAILLVSLGWFLKNYWQEVENTSLMQWLLILIFPLAGALYYGVHILSRKYNLRKIGWLKPFVIGFTWAGWVNIYPVVYFNITHDREFIVERATVLLFLKNFMFVTVLCIMFDIKDYTADYLSRVRTFVVNLGLRKTIFSIVLPLSVIGLGSFVIYAFIAGFHPMKIFLNIIPFVLLILAAISLSKRRSLLYYLVVIDGLMLLKGICGSIAMICF